MKISFRNLSKTNHVQCFASLLVLLLACSKKNDSESGSLNEIKPEILNANDLYGTGGKNWLIREILLEYQNGSGGIDSTISPRIPPYPNARMWFGADSTCFLDPNYQQILPHPAGNWAIKTSPYKFLLRPYKQYNKPWVEWNISYTTKSQLYTKLVKLETVEALNNSRKLKKYIVITADY